MLAEPAEALKYLSHLPQPSLPRCAPVSRSTARLRRRFCRPRWTLWRTSVQGSSSAAVLALTRTNDHLRWTCSTSLSSKTRTKKRCARKSKKNQAFIHHVPNYYPALLFYISRLVRRLVAAPCRGSCCVSTFALGREFIVRWETPSFVLVSHE